MCAIMVHCHCSVCRAFQDKSFTFILKTPPASILLLKACGTQPLLCTSLSCLLVYLSSPGCCPCSEGWLALVQPLHRRVPLDVPCVTAGQGSPHSFSPPLPLSALRLQVLPRGQPTRPRRKWGRSLPIRCVSWSGGSEHDKGEDSVSWHQLHGTSAAASVDGWLLCLQL